MSDRHVCSASGVMRVCALKNKYVCFLIRSKHHPSFPARRLWHFLVKQEGLQETFIRYIFTKKRKQSEVITQGVELCKCTAGAGVVIERAGSIPEQDYLRQWYSNWGPKNGTRGHRFQKNKTPDQKNCCFSTV